MHPVQLIVLSFLSVSLVGWVVLMLPACGRHGPLAWLDALFLSVTSVCVTGLTTVNVGEAVSDRGHVATLLLIQIGGLNYMVISTTIISLITGRLQLARRMLLKETMSGGSLGGVMRLWRIVLTFTLLVEGVGALLLAGRLALAYGVPGRTALWLGVFHSVSAFCNAGIDIFGRAAYGRYVGPAGTTSLIGFAQDPFILGVVASLIVLGGLGFVVVLDVLDHRRDHHLALHTRVVLTATAALILSGAALFWWLESGNPRTLGHLPWPDQLVGALFQSITPRTAGFAAVDQANLVASSKLLTLLLMFIGASPAGTGGGIKTTTFVVILLASWASVRGESDIQAFRRRISHHAVYRALAVAMAGAAVVVGTTFVLSVTEVGFLAQRGEEVTSMLDLVFEATSAFGTVGLSTGITGGLSAGGKLALIAAMLIGRIGPVTLAMALVQRLKPRHRIYPEGEVVIG